jgi:hypothetical protein
MANIINYPDHGSNLQEYLNWHVNNETVFNWGGDAANKEEEKEKKITPEEHFCEVFEINGVVSHIIKDILLKPHSTRNETEKEIIRKIVCKDNIKKPKILLNRQSDKTFDIEGLNNGTFSHETIL